MYPWRTVRKQRASMPEATTYLGLLLVAPPNWGPEKQGNRLGETARALDSTQLRHARYVNAPLARRLRCLRRTKQAMRATLSTSSEVPTIVMTMINTLGMSPARDSKSRGLWAVGGASSGGRPTSVFGHCQERARKAAASAKRDQTSQLKPSTELQPSPQVRRWEIYRARRSRKGTVEIYGHPTRKLIATENENQARFYLRGSRGSWRRQSRARYGPRGGDSPQRGPQPECTPSILRAGPEMVPHAGHHPINDNHAEARKPGDNQRALSATRCV